MTRHEEVRVVNAVPTGTQLGDPVVITDKDSWQLCQGMSLLSTLFVVELEDMYLVQWMHYIQAYKHKLH